MTDKPQMILWLSDARGQYIPRDFAQSFANRAKNVQGVSDDDWKNLEAGPEDETYWDAWQQVLDNSIVIDNDGVRYQVWHDGDCWLVPLGMEWDDGAGTYVWYDEDEDDQPEEQSK